MTANIEGIHHIAIICSDYAKSKDFYIAVFNGKLISEDFRESRNSMKGNISLPGGGQIELFSFHDTPTRVSRPEACGLRHFAIRVIDLELERERLEQFGIDLEPIRLDLGTNKRFCFFADPDNLPIELYEEPKQ